MDCSTPCFTKPRARLRTKEGVILKRTVVKQTLAILHSVYVTPQSKYS